MPFTGIKIFYRELTSKEQLYLSKAYHLLPLQDDYLEDYGRVLRSITESCVENKEDLKNINILEYVMFLCKLRIMSIDEIIELQFKSANLEDETKHNLSIKISLNLSQFMHKLYTVCKEILFHQIIQIDNFICKLNWPNIKCEEYFLQRKENLLYDSIPMFIETFNFNNKTVHLNNFTIKQKIELFEKLPQKYQTKIQENVLKIIKKFSEATFFSEHVSEYIKFNFFNLSYQNFLRMLFTEDLKSLYKLYYIFMSKNIPPSYVDNMTIAERNVYFSLIQETSDNSQEEIPEESLSVEGF